MLRTTTMWSPTAINGQFNRILALILGLLVTVFWDSDNNNSIERALGALLFSVFSVVIFCCVNSSLQYVQ